MLTLGLGALDIVFDQTWRTAVAMMYTDYSAAISALVAQHMGSAGHDGFAPLSR